MQQNKTKWYQKKWIKILAISYGAFVGLLIVGAMMSAFTEDVEDMKATNLESEQSQPKPKEAQYEINIAGNSYADPTSRRVTFTVKNVGSEQLNPSCYVEVYNDTKLYRGYEYITWDTPVQPGEAKYFEGLLTVTNEGAAYATKVKVNCSE